MIFCGSSTQAGDLCGPEIALEQLLQALLAHRAAPDNPLHADVLLLAELVNQEVAALRDTISSLRDGPSRGGHMLMTALRRQVQRFGVLSGIPVHLDCPDPPPVRRALAYALFHMVNVKVLIRMARQPSCILPEPPARPELVEGLVTLTPGLRQAQPERVRRSNSGRDSRPTR